MVEQKEYKKDKSTDFEFSGTYQKKYENIKNLLQSALNQIGKVQNAIENLEQEERKMHYQNVPGTEGVFDGQYLIAEDGRKTEVPENYAAKSKLVYGDILKVFMDSGRQIFKQIDRVERKKIEGVLAKKEGKWYLLTDIGSYKVSDASAEYSKAELNDRASALIPEGNPKVPFASLDRVYKDGVGDSTEKDGNKNKKSFTKPKDTPKTTKLDKKDTNVSPAKKSAVNKPKPVHGSSSVKIKKEEKKLEISDKKEEKDTKEYVNKIMDDDDLR
ncbi:hypothetical protein K0B04_03945 [Patescibacteria group bacterium]|nr:hypothetical protein [Patescibacteria group bacterium]